MRKILSLTSALIVFSVASSARTEAKLPDGEGSAVTKRVCTECHGLDTIVAERHTKAQWQSVVESMVDRGANATDAEVKTIVDYLSKYLASKESDSK